MFDDLLYVFLHDIVYQVICLIHIDNLQHIFFYFIINLYFMVNLGFHFTNRYLFQHYEISFKIIVPRVIYVISVHLKDLDDLYQFL